MTADAPTRDGSPPSECRGRKPQEAGVVAAAALAGEYAEELVLGAVRDVHGAVADRVFAATDRLTLGASRLPRKVHDGIATGTYTGVGTAMRAAAQGLQALDRRGHGPGLDAGPRGRHLISAVNGLIGDRLREERPELAIEMSVRSGGADVQLEADALAQAFPSATEQVAVLVHGLGENDESWEHRREQVGGTYATTLAEGAWTPVHLRVNTGLPVLENGAALAALLRSLVDAWPSEVRRIALVGHSMGGLIVRAACAVEGEVGRDVMVGRDGVDEVDGDAEGGSATSSPRWTDLVTNVVTLGTPHLGAPLERLVDVGARVLGVLPESAPFGRILEYRSVGILDLRRGLAADVQQLPHARYHLVAATLAGSHRHPVSEVLGDLLVRYPSAVGRPRRGSAMFPDADVLHVPGADHFALLNHPYVHDALTRWLA